MPQADTPLDTADLSTLADRQQARFTTGHGPVSVRRYARSSDFVRGTSYGPLCAPATAGTAPRC
ncbi:hypothetical protein ACIGXF_38735 [Streptomyces sp. NPDC053086]|uniref:hypothetical protein n=1 Tax=unclassified Streptomyces TaxID=2593676 RepID=UPI0037D5A5C3